MQVVRPDRSSMRRGFGIENFSPRRDPAVFALSQAGCGESHFRRGRPRAHREPASLPAAGVHATAAREVARVLHRCLLTRERSEHYTACRAGELSLVWVEVEPRSEAPPARFRFRRAEPYPARPARRRGPLRPAAGAALVVRRVARSVPSRFRARAPPGRLVGFCRRVVHPARAALDPSHVSRSKAVASASRPTTPPECSPGTAVSSLKN